MSHEWDRYSILAEINRRGQTLNSLERKYGLPHNTLSPAFTRPFPKAERVFARFLRVKASTLFAYRRGPVRKRRTLRQSDVSRVVPVDESQKCTTASDVEAAA